MIHTFDIASSDTVFLHEDEIRTRPYIKSYRTQSGIAVYAINPNKFRDIRLYTLSDFDLMLKLILKDFQTNKRTIFINLLLTALFGHVKPILLILK